MSTRNPLVSFVLICYKQEKYIREAVEGAFSQTYSPLEIILTDDCSTDRTFDIMREMAAAYTGPHRIVVNRNERNLGVGEHVNRAFGLVTGKWIVTAASDDISDPDRCQRVMDLAAAHPNGGAIGLGWRDIDDCGTPLETEMLIRYREQRIVSGKDPQWIEQFRNGDFAPWGMSVAWLAKMIRATPPLGPEVIQEDEYYSFWCSLLGYDTIYDSHPAVSYRRHSANASGTLATTDFDIQEKRLVKRARMRLATWKYLLKTLETHRQAYQGNWDDHHIARLKETLRKKASTCEHQMNWWNVGTCSRLVKCLFPPEGRRWIHIPREWKRILPYRICKFLRSK